MRLMHPAATRFIDWTSVESISHARRQGIATLPPFKLARSQSSGDSLL
jgi:hypothetical protein